MFGIGGRRDPLAGLLEQAVVGIEVYLQQALVLLQVPSDGVVAF